MCQEEITKSQAVKTLFQKIQAGEDADDALWQAILAYQGCPLRTASGLEFSYTVKQNRQGNYTGELLISRKEESKTLTKSSVFLAFHRVLADKSGSEVFKPPEYKGPKAIGQIFGISYLYSIFWRLGLIRVPENIAQKMQVKT